MSAILADAALAIGGSFAASLLVKATITLGLALAAARLARRSRAAVRHVLLAAAFAVLLALPIASLLIPSRVVAIAAAPAAAAGTPAPVVLSTADAAPAHVDAPAPAGSAPIAARGVRLSSLAAGAWALGAIALLLPILAGVRQTQSLRRSAAPWARGAAAVRTLSADMRSGRRVDVLLHDSITGPMTCGIVRPAILLPHDVEAWTDDELQRALIHELEHVRRGDWASQCLARAVCAAYWCHPMVWTAWRSLRLEAERACDDAVLRHAEPTAYADQLVVLAERLATTTTQPLPAMAARRDLSTRVRAVLDAAQMRGRAGARCITAAVVAATVFVTAIAPLRAVRQDQSAADGAQEPALAFEVASVRPNTSGANEQYFRRDPRGTLTVQNMPLRTIITFAYQIQGFQLQDAPDWIESERFDILARPEGELPMTSPFGRGPDPLRLMLRTLLAERFGLAVHHERREMPIFELVLARQDGRLGSQLRQSTTDCAGMMAAAQAAARSGGAPPVPADLARCGVRLAAGRIVFGGSPLTAFSDMLAPLTQRVVVDRTGLAGTWDFELTFTPDPAQLPAPGFAGPGQPPVALPPGVDPDGPSLFTALEEQLGLKLQPTRGLVEVLVIDRVERPAEN